MSRLDGRIEPARIAGSGAVVGDALVWDGMRWTPDSSSGGGSQTFARDRLAASGSVLTWTLTYAPSANSLHLYLNGVALDESVDYTVSSNVVTITSGLTGSGDVLDARYAYATGSSGGSGGVTYGLPATDAFNRAGPALGSADTGQPWTTATAETATVTISSNKATFGGGGTASRWVEVNARDVDVSASITVQVDASVTAHTNATSYIAAQLLASSVRLFKHKDGIADTVFASTAATTSGTRTLRLKIVGNAVTVHLDGTQLTALNYTLTSGDNTDTPGTGVGFRFANETGPYSTLDNFSAVAA